MWLLVLFDLPVKKKRERKEYTKFRQFLLRDGYSMLQYSVYARVCNGDERVEKHLTRLRGNLPPDGSIRAMQITDKQYERMFLMLGKKRRNETVVASKQLVLF